MKQKFFKLTAGTVVVAVIALFSLVGRAQDTTTKLGMDCALLKGMTIPASAIGLPTGGAAIQTAIAVKAADDKNANGDFCKVTGTIANATPSTAVFEFEVNLPATWNRRVLQMGGGGYDGTLVTGLTTYTMQPGG